MQLENIDMNYHLSNQVCRGCSWLHNSSSPSLFDVSGRAYRSEPAVLHHPRHPVRLLRLHPASQHASQRYRTGVRTARVEGHGKVAASKHVMSMMGHGYSHSIVLLCAIDNVFLSLYGVSLCVCVPYMCVRARVHACVCAWVSACMRGGSHSY